ncbi:BZ3500_MvSof-1268-A1-R1_Chr3-1g05500 [Microbotryum saponariae]|uniref:BZ3500_MvSof-1268-A1-R1_Chr3-1g05500 protein n=1 Tax=Microbotryum saponariae TaxID=289078 RepID=A0A2X0LCX0_9BASI|nr:BZ3500_MvSof-1268-A1-R1_Chr3-1g05500 [Microbotryum saponariae]SDA04691.1 BZ3501_MvSof-1269-A2-R1_Chr3-1g05171 [Microbotryum saponariae]
MADVKLVHTLLDTTLNSIIPLTRAGVDSGAKVFGAAILRKDTLEPCMVATNTETDSPLMHGEITCIQNFYTQISAESRPKAKDTIFFATHEPCSLCTSGITWGGWDNFTYLFSYEETRDTFAIPHDIDIRAYTSSSESPIRYPTNRLASIFYSSSTSAVEQVFKVPSLCSSETATELANRPLYNKVNKFFTSQSISDLVQALPEGSEQRTILEAKVKSVKEAYNDLSRTYQEGKGDKGIPLA